MFVVAEAFELASYVYSLSETVKLEIALGSDKYKPEDFLIEVAKRDSVSRMIEF